MRTAKIRTRRLGFLGALVAALALALVSASPAAAIAPRWSLDSVSNSTVAPGGKLTYLITVANRTDTPMSGDPYTLTIELPDKVTGLSARLSGGHLPSMDCGDVAGESTITCSGTEALREYGLQGLFLTTEVAADAPASIMTTMKVSGGGSTSPATIVDTTRVTSVPPEFGIDGFDGQVAANLDGDPFSQAGGHPYDATTWIDFSATDDPLHGAGLGFPDSDLGWPVEAVKDVFVDLPPGFLGNPQAVEQCTQLQLVNSDGAGFPTCPSSSQVGMARIYANGIASGVDGPRAVYNLDPPPGVAARFGFVVTGSAVTLDAELRSGGDYGVSVNTDNIPAALPVAGTSLTFWGVPASSDHDYERNCADAAPPSSLQPACKAGISPKAFLRLPTACTPAGVGLEATLRADSWQDPGDFKQASFISHDPPARPLPPALWGPEHGPDGCEKVPFAPSMRIEPTTRAADSPSGLEVELTLPQSDEPSTVGTSDLRKAVVTLPQGMSVNPASADGLGACGSAQVALDSPANASCPDNAKIGAVEIETPLLDHPVEGSVFLAAQKDNPFGSLLALYIVAHDPESGVTLKLPGRVETGPGGQLTTTFDDQPQLPFSNLQLQLYSGPRAPLRTPVACGSYAIRTELTGWSGAVDVETDSFQVSGGPNGTACANPFNPKLSGGAASPIAGAHSPFSLRISRDDGSQEISGLDLTLPAGLTAVLKGVPACPQAAIDAAKAMVDLGQGALELASPACPAASQVGSAIVGAGAGVNPFYVRTGKVYFAGPYKGAPLSLAVVTPALAGPFDLGNVVVQTALHVDPRTAQITAKADPIPTILHGIPLDVRDIRVNVDRPYYTLNPTSCAPKSIDASLTSAQGARASASQRFQVGECAALGFKPKLSLRLKGGTKRGQHPKLIAKLKGRGGDANIAKARVTLPHSAFLAQEHIRTVCTRVQFAADACPPGSIYGRASATSPLLDYPLRGNVYLRSSSNKLPDLVADLRGPSWQPLRVELVGRTDSVKGSLRNTFDTAPDAPVSSFRLELMGGKRGLILNSQNLCRGKADRALVELDAHNNRISDTEPVVANDCKKKKTSKKGRKGR